MIYLDYNATTPIAKEVADSMHPFLYGNFGNPSSHHSLGIAAKKAIENARQQVATLLGGSSKEIIFTSGGSESNNMVIKGVAHTFQNKGNHIITSQIEHPSIMNPCKYLEQNGFEVSYLPVDRYGVVKVSEMEKHLTEKTILVTVMHSNNETGALQPMDKISEICREHHILFHTDASQSIGKVPVDVNHPGVDFLTVAGHKVYAPKGIGVLYMRDGIEIEPLIHGAGHESGKRAGTENTLLNVGLGKACEISMTALENPEIKELTDTFYNTLKETFKEKIHLNGPLDKRLPNTLNISFLGYNGYDVLAKLENTAVSTGSACHSGLTTISPVLKAMGVTKDVGRGAVRFSLGRYTTKNEIDSVIEHLKRVISDRK